MKHDRRNAAATLILLLAIVFGCMFAADRIQRGNGTIAVTDGWIETDVGNLMYKLNTPSRNTCSRRPTAARLPERPRNLRSLFRYRPRCLQSL